MVHWIRVCSLKGSELSFQYINRAAHSCQPVALVSEHLVPPTSVGACTQHGQHTHRHN